MKNSTATPIKRYHFPSTLLPIPTQLLIQAFAIFVTHTSFQLYHASFSQTYLQSVHDHGRINNSERVRLSSTRLYDFCDPVERAEWLDVLIALVEYLRSGTCHVGYLNNSLARDMLHKQESQREETPCTEHGARQEKGDTRSLELDAVPLRRSKRKRHSVI
jgi:hypothetical protein